MIIWILQGRKLELIGVSCLACGDMSPYFFISWGADSEIPF